MTTKSRSKTHSIEELLTNGVQVWDPLANDELASLRESIAKSGGRLTTDPVTVSKRGRLIDGHNRLQILRDHFERTTINSNELRIDESATDEESEVLTAIRRQLGRRNVTSKQRAKQAAWMMDHFNWSQNLVGKKLGVSGAAVSKWFKEHPELRPDVSISIGEDGHVRSRENLPQSGDDRGGGRQAEPEPDDMPTPPADTPKADDNSSTPPRPPRPPKTAGDNVVDAIAQAAAQDCTADFREWIITSHDAERREWIIERCNDIAARWHDLAYELADPADASVFDDDGTQDVWHFPRRVPFPPDEPQATTDVHESDADEPEGPNVPNVPNVFEIVETDDPKRVVVNVNGEALTAPIPATQATTVMNELEYTGRTVTRSPSEPKKWSPLRMTDGVAEWGQSFSTKGPAEGWMSGSWTPRAWRPQT